MQNCLKKGKLQYFALKMYFFMPSYS